MELGRLLRELRLKAQMTQEELAERCGLSTRALSDLERGKVRKPQRKTVEALIRALGLLGSPAVDFFEIARGRPPRTDLELGAEFDEDTLALHTLREPGGDIGAVTGHVVPAQLPHDMPGFQGREAELDRLRSILGTSATTGQGTTIMLITGMPGAGKTALAVHLAHTVADRFPDGQVFLDLKGFHPFESPVRPAHAAGLVLGCLGVRSEELSHDPDALFSTLRSLMVGKRMLLLLDNVAEEDQIRPLLPGRSSSLVIVTSRRKLTSLIVHDGALHVPCGGLSPGSARDLLAHIVGGRRVEEEPEAAAELVHLCGHLPLALRIAADKVVADPGASLEHLARELAPVDRCLDALEAGRGGTVSVRSAFSWSYATLKPETALVFRALGIHPTPEFSGPAVAVLAGIGAEAARTHLELLADVNMVERTSRNGRFRINRLLRIYAGELIARAESEEARERAARRLLRHYLDIAVEMTWALRPCWLGLPSKPPPDRAVAGPPSVIAWFEEECATLMASVCLAATLGEHAVAWRLSVVIGGFLSLRKRWAEWIRVLRTGLKAAREGGDPEVEATVLVSLGFAYLAVRRRRDALACLEQALRSPIPAANRAMRDTLVLAVAVARGSRNLRQIPLDRDRQGFWLLVKGRLYWEVRDHERAETHYRLAAEVFEAMGGRADEAVSLSRLGVVLRESGRFSESIGCFERASRIWREIGDPYRQAECLLSIGHVNRTLGWISEAEAAWRKALNLLEALGHPTALIARAQLELLQADDPDVCRMPTPGLASS